MDDLDQLAAATSGASGAAPTATTRSPGPRRPPPRRGKQKNQTVLWACVGGGALLVFVIVIVVALSGSGGGRKFSADFHEESGKFGAWEVTNEGDTPLKITGVTVNREYTCEPAATPGRYGGSYSPVEYPVAVAPGQTWAFMQYHPGSGSGGLFDMGSGPRGYTKRPAYVDFQTDRGNFRYRVDRGWE